MTVWKPHVTVATLLEEAGRFLLVEERIAGKVVLNQPAGHLEEGESLLAAAVRETREETGHQFEPQALIGVYRWQNPGNGSTFLRFCFTGRDLGRDPNLPLDAGIIGPVWLRREEAVRGQLRSPLVLACIDDYLAGKRYPLELLRDLES